MGPGLPEVATLVGRRATSVITLTDGSYSQGFILMTARQKVSRSSSVLDMGEKARGMPSSPGRLVDVFPAFRNLVDDALIA